MTDRKPLMAGNWKSNLNHQEAVVLVQKLAWTLQDKKHDFDKAEVVVIPPFTDIRSVQTLVDGDHLAIAYGAQDVSEHDGGAYTGEISAAMLAKLGCSYVVVGHSERREYHAESDQLVNIKAAKSLAAGMSPIVCVGEGLEIRQAGDHVAYTWRRSTVRSTVSPPSRWPRSSSRTSRCGPLAPARSPRRKTPRRYAQRSVRVSRRPGRPKSRRHCVSFTADQ